MKNEKLYLVVNMTKDPCWSFEVAASPEEAVFNCFCGKEDFDVHCRVEEVTVKGYKILLEKINAD